MNAWAVHGSVAALASVGASRVGAHIQSAGTVVGGTGTYVPFAEHHGLWVHIPPFVVVKEQDNATRGPPVPTWPHSSAFPGHHHNQELRSVAACPTAIRTGSQGADTRKSATMPLAACPVQAPYRAVPYPFWRPRPLMQAGTGGWTHLAALTSSLSIPGFRTHACQVQTQVGLAL